MPPYGSSKIFKRLHQRGKRARYIRGDILKEGKEKLCSSTAVCFGITHIFFCLRLIANMLYTIWGVLRIKKHFVVLLQLCGLPLVFHRSQWELCCPQDLCYGLYDPAVITRGESSPCLRCLVCILWHMARSASDWNGTCTEGLQWQCCACTASQAVWGWGL